MLMPLLAASESSFAEWSLREALDGLPLGNDEREFLEKGIKGSAAFLGLSGGEETPRPLDVYRYFRSWQQAGVAGIFFGLAQKYGSQGPARETWISRLESARTLLEGYWERNQEWVSPKPLLDGNQILEEFQLQPGPWIGELLEALREEQVRSGLASVESGLEFLRLVQAGREEGSP
jgi:hypothetical protein